jgi:hypothetical protein
MIYHEPLHRLGSSFQVKLFLPLCFENFRGSMLKPSL